MTGIVPGGSSLSNDSLVWLVLVVVLALACEPWFLLGDVMP